MNTWTERTAAMLLRLGVPWQAVALYQAIPCSTTLVLAMDRRRR